MLSKEFLLEKVQSILSKSLDIDTKDITQSSLFFTEFNIESTEIMEITFRIEQEFNFTMSQNEFWNIASYIDRKSVV